MGGQKRVAFVWLRATHGIFLTGSTAGIEQGTGEEQPLPTRPSSGRGRRETVQAAMLTHVLKKGHARRALGTAH